MHRLERYLAIGALIGACAASPFGPALAEVVLEPSIGGGSAERAPDVGGQRIVPSGTLRLTCTQYGVKIADERLKNVAISPLNAIGWLSFEQAGGRGRSVLLPFGDGGTACLLSPEAAYLKGAAAAFRSAIAENRPMSWGSSTAHAAGRVVPVRTFADAQGRTCREFTQTVTINGRTEKETGTACERGAGVWRLIP